MLTIESAVILGLILIQVIQLAVSESDCLSGACLVLAMTASEKGMRFCPPVVWTFSMFLPFTLPHPHLFITQHYGPLVSATVSAALLPACILFEGPRLVSPALHLAQASGLCWASL